MSGEQGRQEYGLLRPSSSNFLGQSRTESALSERLGSDGAVGRLPRDNIRVRIQRRSSRLLSRLGLKNPTSAVKPVNSNDTASGSSEAEGTLHQNVLNHRKAQPDVSRPATPSRAQSPASVAQAQRQEGLETPDEGIASPVFTDLKRSQSTPVELARIVSMKLSTTFGSPTVIHRSHLNRRPSVQALHFQASFNGPSNANPNKSSGSSTPSSKGSPVDSLSTAPTSVSPASLRPSGDVNNDQSTNFKQDATHPNITECPLSPVRESPIISPSILTAEAAANAKVFFETYFHTLYSGVDTRAQRQLELDQYIVSLPLSPDERIKVKRRWLAQEREYLRQCRVLKSRSHGKSSHNETPSLAGFEVIKILGRGSFGVVRLVKEKSPDNLSDSSSTEDVKGRQRHAADQTQSVRVPLVPKTNHRQAMTGVKKDVFAMKVIRKSVMIRNSQEGHLRAERDFLVASAKSRWIVPLIASFQDHSYLYLVMDYMVGGDFLGLLMRHNILAEDIARWYVAEMILCIEEAHRLHWIHRDVKPDNFLISASGHLKISDFGLAFDGHWAHDQWYFTYQRHSLLKRLGIQVDGDAEDQKELQDASKQSPGTGRDDGSMDDDWIHPPTHGLLGWRDKNQKRRMARSVVGTSQYMAPEVIRGHPYDGRCDWWSAGIILYECLYGFTPFASEDRHKTKLKIHHHLQTLYFPVHRPTDKLVSAEAIDIINSLLQEKEFRLSSNKYRTNDALTSKPTKCFFYKPDGSNQNYQGLYVYPHDADDIKAHPFFRGINWDEIHRMSPPFIPKVRGWEDTRYFEDGDYPTDHDDESTDSEADQAKEEGIPLGDKEGLHKPEQRPKDDQKPSSPGNDGAKDTAKPPMKKKKHKEPKRPRDKILRDKRFRKTVLEMRKRGAFLGYTYRRPKGVTTAITSDRGRQFIPRNRLTDLYG
ncbi:Serine/threonine-protein kinase cbk1 [Aspergillus falconensis]